MMFELTRDSTEQYKALGVFTESGGIEVARTPERMIELRRRTTQAKSWGIPAEYPPRKASEARALPGRVGDPRRRLLPDRGRRGLVRAGTLMRDQAAPPARSPSLPGAEVLDISVSGDRVRGVVTTAGEIETGNVVICCGVWSPRIARMAARGSRSPRPCTR